MWTWEGGGEEGGEKGEYKHTHAGPCGARAPTNGPPTTTAVFYDGNGGRGACRQNREKKKNGLENR